MVASVTKALIASMARSGCPREENKQHAMVGRLPFDFWECLVQTNVLRVV